MNILPRATAPGVSEVLRRITQYCPHCRLTTIVVELYSSGLR